MLSSYNLLTSANRIPEIGPYNRTKTPVHLDDITSYLIIFVTWQWKNVKEKIYIHIHPNGALMHLLDMNIWRNQFYNSFQWPCEQTSASRKKHIEVCVKSHPRNLEFLLLFIYYHLYWILTKGEKQDNAYLSHEEANASTRLSTIQYHSPHNTIWNNQCRYILLIVIHYSIQGHFEPTVERTW